MLETINNLEPSKEYLVHKINQVILAVRILQEEVEECVLNICDDIDWNKADIHDLQREVKVLILKERARELEEELAHEKEALDKAIDDCLENVSIPSIFSNKHVDGETTAACTHDPHKCCKQCNPFFQ